MRNKSLAVHSTAARPFNSGERRLMTAIAQRFGVTLVKSESDHAPVDALWIRRGVVVGCSEHKVRQWSREEMRNMGDTYLITEQKLLDGMQLGSLLGVPFYVAALLLPDSNAYVWRLTDDYGERQIDWESARTKTQATCEGGDAVRVNAYLPFSKAVEVRVAQPLSLVKEARRAP